MRPSPLALWLTLWVAGVWAGVWAGVVAGVEPPPSQGPAAAPRLSGAELKSRFTQAKSLRKKKQELEALGIARQLLQSGADGAFAKDVRIFLCETKAKLVEKKALPPEETGYRIVPDPELTEVPHIIHQPETKHIRMIRSEAQGGTMLMELTVDADGCVPQAKVLKGISAGLDRAASLDAQAWVFTPAEVHGQPVACHVSLKRNFDMNLDKRLRDLGSEPPPP